MSVGNRKPTGTTRDPDFAGAEAAMHRAAREARRRAAEAANATEHRQYGAGFGEGNTVVESLKTLREAALLGSAEHLRKACECVNEGDWAGSIRESIHTVESVARILAPEAKTLKPALAAIGDQGALHPALRDALNKLYGYTSDEQGVRHPLLDGKRANVGMDEAVFMLGACASFASYLWRKHMTSPVDPE